MKNIVLILALVLFNAPVRAASPTPPDELPLTKQLSDKLSNPEPVCFSQKEFNTWQRYIGLELVNIYKVNNSTNYQEVQYHLYSGGESDVEFYKVMFLEDLKTKIYCRFKPPENE